MSYEQLAAETTQDLVDRVEDLRDDAQEPQEIEKVNHGAQEVASLGCVDG